MYQLGDQAEGLRLARKDGANSPNFRKGDSGGSTFTVAVTSGKGGVGKTQVSANLGVALALRGLKVLLMDADLGLASLDLALGLQPTRDLRAVIKGECEIEEVLMDGPAGVRLIPACPGRYDMANLGPKDRNTLMNAIDRVAKGFDVLIVDTGAGIGSNAVDFASSADEVLLVATPDPTSLRDAYAMAKVLHRRSGVDRIQLVANQVESDSEGAALHDRINGIVKRFLSLELCYLGCIPRDDGVREGVSAGEPFVIRSPRSLATRSVEGLVRRLCPEITPRELC
jgi:flagellar biosynthesis protein FlhG